MAGRIVRKIVKWFFLSLNILCSLLYLIACLSPFVNPARFPLIGFLSLAFPYVAAVLFLSVLFWLVAKPVMSLIPIITLLVGWQQLSVVFAVHTNNSFEKTKADSSLRLITWNVRGLYGITNSSYTQKRNRTEIAALVNKLNPDIVCMQEFNDVKYPWDEKNNIDLFTGICPHYFFSRDFRNQATIYYSGVIVFSKYPIIETSKIKYPGPNGESLIYADIVKGEDTIRIFTTHLESYHFNDSDYAMMQKLKEPDAEALNASENLYSKMKRVFAKQGVQTDLVRDQLDNCPYPSVICGDFNSVPNSYTYFKIKGDRQDAFLSKSFGIGKSYNALAPTLRIDYILPDDHFIINQFQMVDEALSDHHLLVTDLSLKK